MFGPVLIFMVEVRSRLIEIRWFGVVKDTRRSDVSDQPGTRYEGNNTTMALAAWKALTYGNLLSVNCVIKITFTLLIDSSIDLF
jgi:hypothetical protein